MDPLHNYNACVDIETARCQKREECKNSFDQKTCVSFYKEFCRTRRFKGPGRENLTEANINACIAAIDSIECSSFDADVNPNSLDIFDIDADSGTPWYCDYLDISDNADGGV